jgi:sulfonate transport system permease protein
MSDRRATTAGFNLPGLLTFAVVLALWELMIRGGAVQYAYLPAPTAIFTGLVELASTGQLWADMAHTLQAVILGWAIASLAGIALGVILGISSVFRRYSLATIEVLRPMPGIAFVPVALLLFGFSLETELLVIVLPALWPVLINTMGGVANVHTRLLEVGATFRLERAAVVRKVLIPAALPSILVGLRFSITLSLVLAIAAEMVGNPTGLGYAILRDQQALRPTLMFADMMVIGILGILLNQALMQVAWRLFPAASGRLRDA